MLKEWLKNRSVCSAMERRKNVKMIGFLLTDVPEELIHAAGFLPYGITGGHSRLSLADVHLQTWACSFYEVVLLWHLMEN